MNPIPSRAIAYRFGENDVPALPVLDDAQELKCAHDVVRVNARLGAQVYEYIDKPLTFTVFHTFTAQYFIHTHSVHRDAESVVRYAYLREYEHVIVYCAAKYCSLVPRAFIAWRIYISNVREI